MKPLPTPAPAEQSIEAIITTDNETAMLLAVAANTLQKPDPEECADEDIAAYNKARDTFLVHRERLRDRTELAAEPGYSPWKLEAMTISSRQHNANIRDLLCRVATGKREQPAAAPHKTPIDVATSNILDQIEDRVK